MALVPEWLTAAEAADMLADGMTVAVTGSGGGLIEPDHVLEAIEARFLAGGHPRDLTLVHGFGIGDRDRKGVNRFAHRGMVRRVIGSHWTWSHRMIDLAAQEEIEAYALPAGAMALLMRETGARRPGLTTSTGLGTFVDPRQRGGRVNERATEDLVEVVTVEGEEYLRYRPIPVDLAIIRATAADPQGNLSFEDEAAQLDALAVTLAARGSGGRVVAQVKRRCDQPFHNSVVKIPGVLIDAVVIHAEQWQTVVAEYIPTLAGARPEQPELIGMPTEAARAIIARRAAREVQAGTVLNVGFGVSANVIDALAEAGRLDDVVLAIEQGHYGGYPASGDLFGMAHGSRALLTAPDQFDVFAGGRLDLCSLGMGELDRAGNVNVSRLAGRVIGPGGFIDISQGARAAVFCGTFTGKGLRVAAEDGRLQILQEGSLRKIVTQVEEITFSGRRAIELGQRVRYVTERAVFELTPDGVALIEIAPGIDLQRDVLDLMGFAPIVRQVREMDPTLFGAG